MTATPRQRFRRRLLVGAFLSSLGFLVLLGLTQVGWIHAVGLTVLLGLLPTAAVAQVPLALEMELPRVQAYASSAATIAGVALLSLGLSRSGDLQGLGFEPLPALVLTGWTAALVAGGVALALVFKGLGVILGLREDPLLRALLPETSRERRAFVGLSVVAGFGEEMAYRGYALGLLVPLVGTGPGVALSSAVFGVLHAYQGAQGILRTALMGALMAVGFLASGSLWPPVLAHVAYDVLVGLYLADHLMVPDAGLGVGDDADVSVRA